MERSAEIVLVIVPVLLFIVNEPFKATSLKSEADIVPDTCEVVQYNIVPFGTPVVVTVKVTVDPSLTDVTDGVTEYVGTTSATVIVELVATTVPLVELVLTTNVKDSFPSVRISFAMVLVTVAIPVVAPVPTILKDPVSELLEKSAASILPPVL